MKRLKLASVIEAAKGILGDLAGEGKTGDAARHEAAVRLGRWLDRQINTGVFDPIDNGVWPVVAELVLDFAADALDGKVDGQ